MTVILGIDAAWTAKESSGVALVAKHHAGSRALCVAPSYEAFIAFSQTATPVDWEGGRFRGSEPRIPDLLTAAQQIANADVDLVTLDMPVARVPFSSRRAADDAISRAFGGRGCSTHSPDVQRPGRLGAAVMAQLQDAGYPLATAAESCGALERTIEVYPHPALLYLLGRDYRVPYKAQKSLRYWPGSDIPTRIENLLFELRNVERALEQIFGETRLRIPQAADVRTLTALKRHEDAIDALVCAWVGVEYVNHSATAYGDETAAIWVPTTSILGEPT